MLQISLTSLFKTSWPKCKRFMSLGQIHPYNPPFKSQMCWDFSGGPVVKNLLGNAGDMGWIPGWGTKIPHAVKQLSTVLHTVNLTSGSRVPRLESMCWNKRSPVPQLRPDTARQLHVNIFFKKRKVGHSWWSSGKEPAYQCRGHRVDPWSCDIPHAVGQLTHTPQLLKPRLSRARTLQREATTRRSPLTMTEEVPLLTATREKSTQSNKDRVQSKINSFF